MKTLTLASIIAIAFSAMAHCDSAEEEYTKALLDARMKYQHRIATSLSEFDRVEIIQIHKVMRMLIPVEDRAKRISMGTGSSAIVSRKDLDKATARKVVDAYVKQLKVKQTRENNCYNNPCVGIRVYRGKKLLFESVVSTGGGSYLLHYPDHYIWADPMPGLLKLIRAQQVAASDR